MSANPWEITSQVMLKYFWGWSPETWATLSFSNSGRRRTVVSESEAPFIAAICVSERVSDRTLAGKIVGFYLVSHIEGHRNDFTDAIHHSRDPKKWQYGLKASRAFTFLPEYPVQTYDLHPGIRSRAQSVGTFGEWLKEEQIERLKRIPFVEVPVFGGASFLIGDVYVPPLASARYSVKGGSVNRSGYEVAGEPADTEKELYILELTGDASTFLEKGLSDFRIFKVGLSISPSVRLEAFRKSMPRGTFKWELLRSTRRDGHAPYPSFEAAEAGEWAMKEYLGRKGQGRWLGASFTLRQRTKSPKHGPSGVKLRMAIEPSLPLIRA